MSEQNIEMGPCRVLVDEVDCGATIGPARVSVRTTWRDRRSDRYGATLVDRVAVGSELRVTVRVGEKTLANLRRALPFAVEGEEHLRLGRAPGFRAASAACAVRLHPEERADAGRDIVLHRAVVAGGVEIEYAEGRRRSFELEFTALLDPAREEGDWLARVYQAE